MPATGVRCERRTDGLHGHLEVGLSGYIKIGYQIEMSEFEENLEVRNCSYRSFLFLCKEA